MAQPAGHRRHRDAPWKPTPPQVHLLVAATTIMKALRGEGQGYETGAMQ